MRSLAIIKLQPFIQISLQRFNGFVVFGPESRSEEFIKNRPVEPLGESIALRPLNARRSMLDIIESQVYFVRVGILAAVLPSVIGKNGFHFDAPSPVLRQNIVMKDRGRMFRDFTGMQVTERIGTVGVNHHLEVNLADPLQCADEKGILTEKLTRHGTLYAPLFEARVIFFNSLHLGTGQLDLFFVHFLLELQQPFVAFAHPFLDKDTLYGRRRDGDAFQFELIAHASGCVAIIKKSFYGILRRAATGNLPFSINML